MSFHNQGFAARFASMGDEAEHVFETVYPNGYVRFGLNRPPLQMSSLTVRSRYAPDYLTSSGYVEVKGCGRDQIVKFKYENLNALQWWNSNEPVHVFVWDSHKKRHTTIGLRDLDKVINDPESGVTFKHFHDPKGYFGVPCGALGGWVSFDPDVVAV